MSNVGCGAISWSVDSALFVSDAPNAADILYFPIRTAAVAKQIGLPLDKPPRQARHIEGDWYLSSPSYPL
jgi:hypothetical protein